MELTCKVLKKSGSVVGCYLLPDREADSEAFCAQLKKNFLKESSPVPAGGEKEAPGASIVVEGDEIIFFNPQCSHELKEFRVRVPADDAVALRNLIEESKWNKDCELREPDRFNGDGMMLALPNYEPEKVTVLTKNGGVWGYHESLTLHEILKVHTNTKNNHLIIEGEIPYGQITLALKLSKDDFECQVVLALDERNLPFIPMFD